MLYPNYRKFIYGICLALNAASAKSSSSANAEFTGVDGPPDIVPSPCIVTPSGIGDTLGDTRLFRPKGDALRICCIKLLYKENGE